MISKPAVILPRARRMIGLVIVWLFSFTGMSVIMRVNPVWTIDVMRRV